MGGAGARGRVCKEQAGSRESAESIHILRRRRFAAAATRCQTNEQRTNTDHHRRYPNEEIIILAITPYHYVERRQLHPYIQRVVSDKTIKSET
jgi:hypothetical protein